MSNLSRRNCMTLALAAAGSLTFEEASGARHRHSPKHAHRAGSAPDSLNGIARSRGLRFGNALGSGPSGAPARPGAIPDTRSNQFDDKKLRALMIAQCSILVHENELKWYALRKTPTGFDFSRADKLIAFAEANGMAVRGHNLLWNRPKYSPPWLEAYDFGPNPRAAAEKMLREHIATVCGRYGKRIFSYDVINETIVPETGELEQGAFTRALGPDVVDIAFHAAREAAPHAELVYNDYMGWEPRSETHRTAVLKLLERMKKNNVPIDTLGVQSHIGSNSRPNTDPTFSEVQEAEWRRFLDEVTGMGIDLVITEFDVNDRGVPGDIAVRDKAVTALGWAFLDQMLSYKQLRYVMAWGMVDKYSWLQHTAPRPDGLPKRPCPYDDDFRPKALREAMAGAFRVAPARPLMKIG
jgi:endo-1,4-beta-xylanase